MKTISINGMALEAMGRIQEFEHENECKASTEDICDIVHSICEKGDGLVNENEVLCATINMCGDGIKVDYESSYQSGFPKFSSESGVLVNEYGEAFKIVSYDEVLRLHEFLKQPLTLEPDDVYSDSIAVNAALDKACCYGENCEGVRLIGNDAAGFIYTDRNSGAKYIDICTPDGEYDYPYNAATIASVIHDYVPDMALYAADLKKRGRKYDIALRFFNELLNVPTELIEDALAYIAGDYHD